MYQLAQINVARMKGANLDDPIMAEFVANLDKVNALAAQSDGFIWQPSDEYGDDTSNPFHDEQVIINISVWRDIDSLKQFVYRTYHADIMRRQKEWFHKYGEAHMALWWIKAGEYPRPEQCLARLKFLQKKGPTEKAFTFKDPFPMPQQPSSTS